jgi:hypothetical protein
MGPDRRRPVEAGAFAPRFVAGGVDRMSRARQGLDKYEWKSVVFVR